MLSLFAGASVLAVGLVLSGCAAPTEQPPETIASAIVTTAKPSGATVTAWSGLVRPKQGALLAFSVAGRVQTVHAEVGDLVEAGAVLMELDAEPFRLQLQLAEAEAAAAAPALAEATRRREVEQRLWAKGSTSLATYEAAQSAYAAAAGRVATAEANVALARRALRESKLLAPASGRVARRLVSAASVVLADTAVIDFDPAGTTEAVVAIPSAQLTGLSVGQPIEILHQLTRREPGRIRGTVSHIGQRSLVGGVHEVLVSLPDTTTVVAGEPVLARLPESLGTADATVRVPVSAVRLTSGGLGEVLVLNHDAQTVKARMVSVGQPVGNEIVITGGLQAGERVVATGAAFLREGQKIRAVLRE